MLIQIDQIIRSRRRSIALEITADARLVVRIPRFVTMEKVKAIVEEKKQWIIKKLDLMRKKQKEVVKRNFIEGEQFLYLGELYQLFLVSNKPFFENGFYLPSLAGAQEIFEKWYRAEALRVISERVKRYAFLTGLKPKGIRINNAKRQWGSCNTQGILGFTWRLIMAPLEVVDYVIAHEMAHLVERNHGVQFWQKVGEIMPSYKKQRKWLKDNGHLLAI